MDKKKERNLNKNIQITKQIRQAQEILSNKGSSSFNFVEMDEMWSFVKNKKKRCWIWLAICRFTKLVIGFVTGTRGKKTGKKLYDKIKDLDTKMYYTDYWEPYEKFLPKEKHIQSKKETYTVEGYNASFRDDLRRLTRKTRAYSKSQDMLNVSLNLYIAKHNQTKLNELLSI